MKSHSPASLCRSGGCADMAARAQRVWSRLKCTALTLLIVAGLAFSGAPAWATDQPVVADDVQCDGCVGTTDVEDGSLTKGDLSFVPQERVSGSCPAGSSIRAVNADGSVSCETDTDTDTLSNLAKDAGVCPDGSYLQLDPLGSRQWRCLSLLGVKVALGLVPSKFVFVTEEIYNGALYAESGSAGSGSYYWGDALCNQSASAAGLQGSGENNYFAWLSFPPDTYESPPSPLDSVDSSVVYTLVDGTPVFRKTDLQSCDLNGGADCLKHPIDMTGSGNTITDYTSAWTSTYTDGSRPNTSGGIDYCGRWQLDSSSYRGLVGSTSAKDATWTYSGAQSCDTFHRLYCMEK